MLICACHFFAFCANLNIFLFRTLYIPYFYIQLQCIRIILCHASKNNTTSNVDSKHVLHVLYRIWYIKAHECIPGVMQFESNLSSFGRTWPFSRALRMLSSASLADLLENAKKNVIDYCKDLCISSTFLLKFWAITGRCSVDETIAIRGSKMG